MLLYCWLCPNRRRGIVLTGAAAHLLTGGLWIASSVAVTAPRPLQDLLGALRALPYELALAYVCYLVVRSVGKNHPLTERLLATGVYVLPCLPLVLGATTAIYFPQPAIDSTTPGTIALIVPRIRNLVEVVYLVLITSVFARETLRPSTSLLRVQNGSLTFAGISLLTAISTNFPITAARIAVQDGQVLSRYLVEFHRLQLGAMGVCGVGFLAGILLYYSAEEREAMLRRCRAWIRYRYEIEAAAYEIFGSGLGNSRSGTRAAAYYYRAAAMLCLEHRQREQGRLTIVLVALMLDPRYDKLVSELESAQHHLLRSPEFGNLTLSRIGGHIRYDIRDDDLYKALEPARRLAGTNLPQQSSGHTAPQWLQLAAIFSADAGFLAGPVRQRTLNGDGPHGTVHVASCYKAAKRIEDDVAS